MYKPLKFPYLENTYYWVSCIHRRHDRDFIYKPRGYNNVFEHDDGIEKLWNEKLNEDAIVFCLGDSAFGYSAEKELEYIFDVFNFKTLYLSPGNHTSGWKQMYERILKEKFGGLIGDSEVYPLSYQWRKANKTVVFMPNLYEVIIGKQFIVNGHYPIISHNKQSHGAWGIFGHSHANLEFTQKHYKFGKRVDTCIESFGRPVSYEELEKVMANKQLDNFDHH